MSILKSSLKVSSAILSSRLLGYFREIMMASALGTGMLANAFHVAFRFTNMFRAFLAEGAFSAAFIPIYSNKFHKDKKSAINYASNAQIWLIIVLILVTIFAEIFTEEIMRFLAPGFKDDEILFKNTVLFARINFPYLIFMSLSSLYTGILATSEKYFIAAISSIALNISMIIALILFPNSKFIGEILSISVIISGVIQLFILIYTTNKLGIYLNLRLPKFDSEMRFFIVQMIPGILSGGVVQINLWFSTIIATYYASAVSIMYYADRIIQLPLALIGTATSIVLLPIFSKNSNETIHNLQVKRGKIFQIMSIISCILSAYIFATSFELIDFTLGYGKFTKNDTLNTSRFLSLLSLALPAFILNKIMTPFFYANHDTKTPFKAAIISLIINLIANIVFMKLMNNYLSIAYATILSAWTNLIILCLYGNYYRLIKQFIPKNILIIIIFSILIMIIFSQFKLDISIFSIIFKGLIILFIYIIILSSMKIINIKYLFSKIRRK